jgi:hypothetical protein
LVNHPSSVFVQGGTKEKGRYGREDHGIGEWYQTVIIVVIYTYSPTTITKAYLVWRHHMVNR